MTITLILAGSAALIFMLVFLIELSRDTRVTRSEVRVSRVERKDAAEPEQEKSRARAA